MIPEGKRKLSWQIYVASISVNYFPLDKTPFSPKDNLSTFPAFILSRINYVGKNSSSVYPYTISMRWITWKMQSDSACVGNKQFRQDFLLQDGPICQYLSWDPSRISSNNWRRQLNGVQKSSLWPTPRLGMRILFTITGFPTWLDSCLATWVARRP